MIGHMKTDGHLGCHLKGREGDAANVVLTAIGHNLRRVLAWLKALLRPILVAVWMGIRRHAARQMGFLTADYLGSYIGQTRPPCRALSRPTASQSLEEKFQRRDGWRQV